MIKNLKMFSVIIGLMTILCAGVTLVNAQSPQAFKYQAVARNLNGDPVIDQEITVKISILSGSETGPVVYSELHGIPTNQMGLFTLEIGTATYVLFGNFSEIGWGYSTHFLKTEIDITGGENYQLMGVSQLLSVPYALYANQAANAQNYVAGTGINVSNGVISNTAPNATHTGDATGGSELTVGKIQGRSIATTAPSNGEVLQWNMFTMKWEPATDDNTTYTAGSGINVVGTVISNTSPDQTVVINAGTGISASGTYPDFTVTNTSPNATHTGDATGSSELTVVKIQGKDVATTVPTNGQALKWNSNISKWQPSADNNNIYTAGTGIDVTGAIISNSLPDQTVILNNGSAISITGTYPNFTVTNTLPNATHTGDVSGSGALTVSKIQGKAVSPTVPATNQVLQWNGTQWTPSTLTTPAAGWLLAGNSGTSASTNFIGTTDNVPLSFRVNNIVAGKIDHLLNNTSLGYRSLASNTTGSDNSATGYNALYTNTTGYSNTANGASALYSTTTGNSNTASGTAALYSNTTGYNNTAQGVGAIFTNTTGFNNTANGLYALYSNSTGHSNTANGSNTLYSNTTGLSNTANGYHALYSCTEGDNNTASGANALNFNTSGHSNTAGGVRALYSNTSGDNNTANGFHSLYYNTTGFSNVALGTKALYRNTTRSNLVAIGDSALYYNGVGATEDWDATNNTAVGSKGLFENTTGYSNTAIGASTLSANTIGSFNTANGERALFSNTEGSSNTANGAWALQNNTTGNDNTATGQHALGYNTTGNYNTANGYYSLYSNTTGNNNTAGGKYALHYNTTGNSNVAIGVGALNKNTTRSNLVAIGDSALYNNGVGANSITHAIGNTAVGSKALFSNTTGHNNTANGASALYSNTYGAQNTACGFNALYSNTDGYNNTANGFNALYSNTWGVGNTANGYKALYSNTGGYSNTANGESALFSNKTGTSNTATGLYALFENTYGDENTANGSYALRDNTFGVSNTAIGCFALWGVSTGNQNTSVGALSLWGISTSSYNTAVGYNAGPNDDYANTTCLGIDARATGSNLVRIGNTFVTSIGGYQNWTNISDSRVKENVSEDVPGLSFITQLRPVTFQLNREKINEFNGVNERRNQIKEQNPDTEFLEGDKYSQVTTGFLAQEVEAAAKSIGFDFSGVDAPKNEKDMYGLRYAEFVVPLVKAVQEQQKMIAEMQQKNEELQKQIDDLKASLKR
jgi:hypothetical protein